MRRRPVFVVAAGQPADPQDNQMAAQVIWHLFQPTLDGYGYEVADCGLLSADLAAGIHRVKGAKRLSAHVENWLIAAQGKRLLLTAGEAGL
jgi:hypothetical protein